jgi:hypothetical protein
VTAAAVVHLGLSVVDGFAWEVLRLYIKNIKVSSGCGW